MSEISKMSDDGLQAAAGAEREAIRTVERNIRTLPEYADGHDPAVLEYRARLKTLSGLEAEIARREMEATPDE